MYITKRSDHNPIISPNKQQGWSSFATFNWCPYRDEEGLTHVVYRAMTQPDLLSSGPRFSISSIGYAKSGDGLHFDDHTQLIFPEHPWEMYGCEDPRVTKIDDTYYIFYTALSRYPFHADGIKVAVATTKDFKTIKRKELITPFNSKAMTLFPKRINGKLTALLTVNPDRPPAKMAIIQFDNEEQMYNKEYWQHWYHTVLEKQNFHLNRNEHDHCEVGAPPVWTSDGWLVVYSHIQNYFDESKRVFGIEAVLLDHDDPQKIIGRTTGPIMVPEKMYEEEGQIKNITFPSGALLHDDQLNIYYGAADSYCCMATVNIHHLLDSMISERRSKHITRSSNNPLLQPIPEHSWESKLVFNPTTVDVEGRTYIIYRAMSEDNTSYMGCAITEDGETIAERFPDPIYVPRADFELKKGNPNGNSGCEDGRATVIGDTLYMIYTAYDGINVPKVAISSISLTDFIERKWSKWTEPQLVTPDGVDDKDACLLPKTISDEYWIMHRVKHYICMDNIKELDFTKHRLNKCIPLIGPRTGMWDELKVGIAGPPIYTEAGWLLLYHGVSNDAYYRVSAMLMEHDNPSNIIGRCSDFILEPEEEWERIGEVNNIVFPCGASIRNKKLYIYYGGADTVIGVAYCDLNWLLEILTWKQDDANWL